MLSSHPDYAMPHGQMKRVLILCTLLILPGFLLAKPARADQKTSESAIYHFAINGIDGALLNNASARLRILQKKMGRLTPGKIMQLISDSQPEIKSALAPYGYYKAKVKATVSHQGQTYQAVFDVNKGLPVLITNLNVSIVGVGKDNPALQAQLKKIPLKDEQVLIVTQYQKTRQALMRTARAEGFLFAYFSENQVVVNVHSRRALVRLTLNTGPRYYFGEITLNKTPLKEIFLRKFIHFKPGEPYNEKKITDLQTDYGSTDYFRRVDVSPTVTAPAQNKQANHEKHTVPVSIKLKMNKKYLYQIGVGYGTYAGPQFSGALYNRWVNDRGDKYNINGVISKQYYELGAQYLIPANDPVHGFYSLNGAIYILLPPNNARAYVKKFGPGYVWKDTHWNWSLNLFYQLEQWRLNGSSAYTDSHLLQPNLGMTYVSTDNILQVENGYKLNVTTNGAAQSVLSSVNYFQTQVQFKIIRTLSTNNRFILMTQAGATWVSDLNRLPLSVRFYAGGPSSVLGFAYQDIGPGRYLAVANLAYQRRISGPIYGETFYDLGSAFNERSQFASALGKSAGLALVWRSPVGDIKIYWAKLLSQSGVPNAFGFNLGAEL